MLRHIFGIGTLKSNSASWELGIMPRREILNFDFTYIDLKNDNEYTITKFFIYINFESGINK